MNHHWNDGWQVERGRIWSRPEHLETHAAPMTKPSPFYARIKRDVLAIVAAVPEGALVTFKDVGAHLDVVPRHVAYILATLDPLEASTVPWFRVVPDNGSLTKPKSGPDGRTQRQILEEEGHAIAPDGRMLDLARRMKAIGDLPHGVPSRTRPANAPRGSSRG